MNIENLQHQITAMRISLKQYIKTLDFCEPISINDLLFDSKVSFSGVYKIEINLCAFSQGGKQWKNEFIDFWDLYKGQRKFTPSSKKKRLNLHKDDNPKQWIPLYIGRCLDIRSRIEQHKNLTFKQVTRGLKLEARGIYNNDHFRVSFVELPEDNYDIISIATENYFRDKLNPLVGN